MKMGANESAAWKRAWDALPQRELSEQADDYEAALANTRALAAFYPGGLPWKIEVAVVDLLEHGSLGDLCCELELEAEQKEVECRFIEAGNMSQAATFQRDEARTQLARAKDNLAALDRSYAYLLREEREAEAGEIGPMPEEARDYIGAHFVEGFGG